LANFLASIHFAIAGHTTLFHFTIVLAMFSKLAVAAGLLGSALAQSTTTIDVFASTTTVNVPCSSSVCTVTVGTGGGATVAAGPGSTVTVAAGPALSVDKTYTVIVNNGLTTLVGSGVDPGATAASTANACGFALAVNGTTTLQQISDGQIQAHAAPNTVGQISDGQVQSGSGLVSSAFTISNGMVYDQVGRICSISGDNQFQFQCNYVPTIGSVATTFSLVGMNLAFNGNTQFYACLLGGPNDGYNIYQTLSGVQHSCSPIVLTAIGSTNCSPPAAPTAAAPAPTVAVGTPLAPSAPATTVPAGNSPSTPAASNTLPVVNTLPTASPNGASSVSPSSAAGLVIAAAFSYLLL